MTLVNTETGEVTEALSEAEAERLSNRISLRLDTIADNYAAVMPMIREAIERRAHEVLGYRSPGEYAADRFGAALSKLGPEMRQAVVRELSDLGMSTRAIAPIVGVGIGTVSRDRNAPVPTGTPETPASEPEGEADEGAGQNPEGEVTHAVANDTPVSTTDEHPTPRPPVIGLDGKTYTRPARPEPAPSVDLTGFIESDSTVRLTSWRKHFMAAIAKSGELMLFDPADVADKADVDLVNELERLSQDLNNYVSRVHAKRPHRLTAIRGGAE